MLYAIIILLGIIVGILAKGKFTNLLNIKFEKTWLILSTFIMQLFILIAEKKIEFNTTFTMLLQLLIFCLLLLGFWFNRHYIGICVIGIGYFSNALVILLNGGKMPVSLEVVKRANLLSKINDIDMKHSIFSSTVKVKLPFLADIMHPPFFLSTWMQIVSIGDLIIAVGLFILMVETVMGRKLRIKNKYKMEDSI